MLYSLAKTANWPAARRMPCLVRAVILGCISPAQPIAIDEHDITQHPMIIHVRLTVGLGGKGRRRSICSSVSRNRSLIPFSSRSLNQIARATSMGPDLSGSQSPTEI
jgi:hypothetical protein